MRNETNLQYTIIPRNPQAHIFEVECRIEKPDLQGQIIYLPAWIPGSYMIRDFAKNIVQIHAYSQDQEIALQKLDKQTWQCEAAAHPLTIIYTVYAWDLSVRTAHLDTTHGFFNGSSVFIAVKGQESDPVSVNIQLPEGAQYTNWRVATTLERIDTELFSAGHYHASDYDTLIDHPVEMGTFDEVSFTLHDVPHHIVVTGRQHADLQRLSDDVKKICATHITMFGELPSMQRYMFLLTVVGDGYGGLEHRSSTALICSRRDLPDTTTQSNNPEYTNLLGLFSHEYFHTWNVKRIKPAEFIPYQLQQESYTRLLWAFEGITSYYDELALIRSGVIDQDTYLQLLGKNITRVLRGSGRLKQSLRDSSFDAWTKFYKQDENAPNAIVSYYVKGGLFALCLDLMLRTQCKQPCSLDAIMRTLWLEYGKPNRGINDQTIPQLAENLSGQTLSDFFYTYLDTMQDLPLIDMLAYAGVTLSAYASDDLDDAGGKPPAANRPACFNLGAKLVTENGAIKVLYIHDGGALQHAGIAVGDMIIAVDRLKTKKEELSARLQRFEPGAIVEFSVFRRDELYTFDVVLQPAQDNTYYLSTNDDEHHIVVRKNWLGLN